MRLTLRNMLASMDEILEPAQQEEIKRKIEESEFATGIMHRIRDVTRRIRLGAPKLTGKGMGLDPNTVAMYLDNTLAAERVPDFEKVCLESDVHLAEVAACHQVLALVLGEPAEIDPALRQKLYNIGQTSATAEKVAGKAPPPLPPVAEKSGRRERPHVPEYLREERRSRWWTVAATTLLAVLLAGAVVGVIGFDRTLRMLGIRSDEELAKNGDVVRAPADESNGTAGAKPADVSSPKTPKNGEKVAPDARNGEVSGAADETAKGAALEDPLDRAGKTIPTDGPQRPADDSQAPLPPEPAGELGAKDATAATPDAVDSARDAPPDNETAPADSAAVTSEQPADATTATRNGAQPLGRFLADPNVLLRLSRSGKWERAPQGATLTAGEQLLVLPTYRPSITLSAGLTMQVLGETLVELLQADGSGVPGVRMPYGRLVLMTAGRPDVSIHLSLGGQEGTARFLDAESTLAVEVRRFLPAGANPEEEPAYVAVDLYASSGDIEWKLSENPAPRRISATGRLTLGTPYPYAAADEPKVPDWVTAEKLGDLDELASADMNRALSEENERPVALAIRELAEHRRWELKYLGARSLALMDEFDFFVPAFNDEDQRGVWARQIESLQAALARGPETAAKVREAFQKQRGVEDGWKLYRMLAGYSKADIQSGVAEQLVGYLSHNSLDFRVLAIHALRSVPGVPRNYSSYLPAGHPRERQTQVRRWREYIKGDKSPLTPEGALDQPAPAPKRPWRGPESISDVDAGGEESATNPRTVPMLR